MTNYDPASFTYGFELEWGDIPRSVRIPEHLGRWDGCERDVVNLLPPYQNIAADPLGIKPPVGGEINTVPTLGWQGQVELIALLKEEVFKGHTPTACCLSHSHVHVHVPGLKGDIEGLRRLAKYVGANQSTVIAACGQYSDDIFGDRKRPPQAKSYMKYDGGRLIPDWMIDNMVNYSEDFDSFLQMISASKDRTKKGRPLRFGINLYALRHIETVEFRFFRGSTDPDQIGECFRFVEGFMTAALNGGESVEALLLSRNWNFPPCYFDFDQWKGHRSTKYSERRGKKMRKFHEPSSLRPSILSAI